MRTARPTKRLFRVTFALVVGLCACREQTSQSSATASRPSVTVAPEVPPYVCQRGTPEAPAFFELFDVGGRCRAKRISVEGAALRDGALAWSAGACMGAPARRAYACVWERLAKDLSEATDDERELIGEKRCSESERVAMFELAPPLMILTSANFTCVWDLRSGQKIYDAPDDVLMIAF